MTEQEVKESAQEVQEPVEQPTPAVPSVPSEAKPPSEPKAQADDIARLDDLIEKKIQSFKDRRLSKVDDIEKKLSQLIELYEGQPKAAPEPSQSAPGSAGGGGQAYMEAMSAEILTGAEIAANDPEYIGLVQQYEGRITNPEQWVTVVREFAGRRQSKVVKQEGVTGAAVVSPQAGSAKASANADELAEELHKLQYPGAGDLPVSHPDNVKRRKEINARLKELTPQRPDIK